MILKIIKREKEKNNTLETIKYVPIIQGDDCCEEKTTFNDNGEIISNHLIANTDIGTIAYDLQNINYKAIYLMNDEGKTIERIK